MRAALRRTFSALDSYNYRLLFVSELISHTGGWMQNMAEAWLVLTLTHSGAAVGATFAFERSARTASTRWPPSSSTAPSS